MKTYLPILAICLACSSTLLGKDKAKDAPFPFRIMVASDLQEASLPLVYVATNQDLKGKKLSDFDPGHFYVIIQSVSANNIPLGQQASSDWYNRPRERCREFNLHPPEY